MLGVAVVYLGLISGLLGVVSFLKPPSWLGIRRRRQAAYLLATGFVIVLAGWALPAKEVRVDPPRTQLDQFMPVYQFREFHSIRVAASKEKVYGAIKSVTAGEISMFRTLTWIRRLGRSGPESIVHAPEHQPILDVATKTSFLLLAEEPNHEIVVGTAVVVPRGWRPRRRPTPEDFRAAREPGFALAAMNFLIEDAGPGACTVTTETRIFATDMSARRRFAAYWRVIYPGSALIRRMWLRAIVRRAESPNS
ncbi:MAG: hypothetical protein WCC22_13760 [Terriglobales bacterium]